MNDEQIARVDTAFKDAPPPRVGEVDSANRGIDDAGVAEGFKQAAEGVMDLAKDIEVVTPYTVHLNPLLKNDGSSVHVVAVEGQVQKDDVLLEMNSGKLWRVVELNSKSRSPKVNSSKVAGSRSGSTFAEHSSRHCGARCVFASLAENNNRYRYGCASST